MEIKINYAAIDEATNSLQNLIEHCNSLENKLKGLPFYTNSLLPLESKSYSCAGNAASSGAVARTLCNNNLEFFSIVSNVSDLFLKTKKFLEEAKNKYQNDDQMISKQI